MLEAARNLLLTAKAIQTEVDAEVGPPPEGLRARGQAVIITALVSGTRGYIERIANQVNGSYENGWYDACAVMVRRLLETLLIESFEHHGIADRIKNQAGDFLYLRDMIDSALKESRWNLSRNCKQAMPRLKDVGDKSAHSRRYNALRGDFDRLLPDIRIVVQELVYLAGLK